MDKLPLLNSDAIHDIFNEDETYINSFYYLKDYIISKCEFCFYNDVWKTLNPALLCAQDEFNNNNVCQIIKDGIVLRSIPNAVKIDRYNFPVSEIHSEVFIESLISFFKRGKWHIGYKDSVDLPEIRNNSVQTISQEGRYPIIWFNDSEEFVAKMAIWTDQQQYRPCHNWASVSTFCSNVFSNTEIHNNYRNKGHELYKKLEAEFERVKSECPIQIKKGNEPIDFD